MNRPLRQRTHQARPQVEVLEAKQLMATFMVIAAADSGPGSLRQAILDADADSNAKPVAGITQEQIQFAIPGDGVQTIAPTTPLPTIDQPTAIDATTQPGYAGSPLVVLDGLNAVAPGGGPVVGLDFSVGDNTVGTAIRGLGIVRFSGSGIQTDTFGTDVTGVVIGTDAAGGKDLGNGGYGIKFGINGGNNVTDSVIENNKLRAIGGVNDAPGVPFQSGQYCTTRGVEEANNDTQATKLVVSAPDGTTPGSIYIAWGISQTLTYTITNTGPIAATDVTVDLVQNPLSHLLSVRSAGTTQGTIGTTMSADGNYPAFANLGTLAPGASATITVTVDVGSQADFPSGFGQLTAIASSPQLDYAPSQTSATYDFHASATGVPPTTLAVSVPGDPFVIDEYARWGSVVTLTYTVTNMGTTDITDVTVALAQAKFSHLLSVISATSSQGAVGTNLSLDDDHPAFATLGTLAPGASATLTIKAQVGPEDPTDAQGDIITATASAPQVDSIPASARFAEYTIIPNATGQPPAPTDPAPPPPPVFPVGVTTPPGIPIFVPTPVSTIGTPLNNGGSGSGSTVAGSAPIGVGPIVPPPADLVVSATAPVGPRVGAASLFTLTVKDVGSSNAKDAVAALDLGGIPTGSFYSILSRESTGGSGKVRPVVGRPGVYLIDLGSIAAGASATVAVMVMPNAAGPIGLSIAASDAGNPVPDLKPADNFAAASSWVAPAVQLTDVEMPSAGVIQLNFDSALPKAQAESLANYRLTTSGAAGSQPASTIRLRSANYDSANHRVTLRLAHPVSVGASAVRLSLANLGTTGAGSATTLSLARKYRPR